MLSRSAGLEVASLGVGSWVSPVSGGAVLVGINTSQPCPSGALSAAEQPQPGSACCTVHAVVLRHMVGWGKAAAYEWAEDSAVLLQEWIDHKLSWNPDEYGGITAIRVPSESLWLPDIVLFEKWVAWLLALGLGQSLGKACQLPWGLCVLSEGCFFRQCECCAPYAPGEA